MQNYKSVNKNSNKSSNEGKVHGYIPRSCDLKCYKCQYQGICIIPRRLIKAKKRSIRNSILGNRIPINNKYKLNDFLQIFGYKRKLLRYLANLKKKKLYNKD
jgi:hypothetical protein